MEIGVSTISAYKLHSLVRKYFDSPYICQSDIVHFWLVENINHLRHIRYWWQHFQLPDQPIGYNREGRCVNLPLWHNRHYHRLHHRKLERPGRHRSIVQMSIGIYRSYNRYVYFRSYTIL